jgi:hypothetical protein
MKELPNAEDIKFEEIHLGDTIIDISGKACNVSVYRNKGGNIEIIPTDKGIWEKGGWLYDGTCTEGYNDEVLIYKYIP